MKMIQRIGDSLQKGRRDMQRPFCMQAVKSVWTVVRRDKEIWLCALLGAAAFLYIYGAHILNPTYVDWLMASEDGDLTQHYLGWKFYRHGSWGFPFGLVDTMAYPNETSVIFTDSIPLFAFVFKLFRFLLPVRFQYFGWFGLMCFMLQGALGAKLAKKYVEGSLGIAAGGMFFVLSPVFIDRMYWMTSLAGHFLCLLGILYIVYYREKYRETKKAVAGWGALGALCAGIHIYFLPMCGILLLGFMWMDLAVGKKKWKALLPLFAYLAGAAVTVFAFGGFASGMDAGNDGLGHYSFNLNGFVNPHGWSRYLKDMPYTDSQYEGFGYLGLGLLLLLVFSASSGLGNWMERRKAEGCKAVPMPETGVWALVFLLTLFAAASNVVMYHERVLFEAPLPGPVFRLWSVFRATGRFIWPAVYLLALGAVAAGGRSVKRQAKTLLLTVCLILQFMDIRGVLEEKNAVYNKEEGYRTLLADEGWERIGRDGRIRHICFVSDMVSNRKLLFSFGDYASDYGLTLNDFYFARSLGGKVEEAREQALAECPEDTVFLFFDNEAQKALGYPLLYYKLDGLVAACREPIDGLEPVAEAELMVYRYQMDSGRFLNNAEVVEDGWKIHSYGNSYGPYLNAGAGRYRVTVQGAGLNAIDIKCYYGHGETSLEPQNVTPGENELIFEVELTEYAPDLEVALWNTGSEDILVTSLVIQKQGSPGK